MMTVATMKKLEVCEMWLYHHILDISWTDRITNENDLHRHLISRSVKWVTLDSWIPNAS